MGRYGSVRLLAAGVVGVTGGVLLGGRLVKTYHWRSEWRIPASPSTVYDALTSRAAVAQWWQGMDILEPESDAAVCPGSSVTLRVHQAPEIAWLTGPVRIDCVYTDVEPGRRFRQIVTGDLQGILEVVLSEDAGGGTRVVFNWHARLSNPVLGLLGYFLEDRYRRSHDAVLLAGERSLVQYCRALAPPVHGLQGWRVRMHGVQ